MAAVWFCLAAIVIATYVVLDGFDLGAGVIHLCVARSERERGQILESIGPFWDGNEVWLISAGGTLYFAFPALYSSAFSGFYLALMIVLWLLILRGIAIEFRNHVESPLWRPFWDVVFGGSSALLAFLLGVALGNVVRGVPIDRTGYFFLPLWTNFLPNAAPGVIDWYTVLIGSAALLALAEHAALWVVLKTGGDLQERSRAFFRRGWWALTATTALITITSFYLQPTFMERFESEPWGWIFPAVALAGLFGMRLLKDDLPAFLASCVFLIGMLTSAAFSVYPNVLSSNVDSARSLTVYNAAAPDYGLRLGLWWWIPGMLLAAAYTVFVYRRFGGKVTS